MSEFYPVAVMRHEHVEGQPSLLMTPALLDLLDILPIEFTFEAMMALSRPFSQISDADNRLFITELDLAELMTLPGTIIQRQP